MENDNPYAKAKQDYRLRLKDLMENDYKLLEMNYTLLNLINEQYNQGKLDLLTVIDKELLINREITTIHDRIRKRLHL